MRRDQLLMAVNRIVKDIRELELQNFLELGLAASRPTSKEGQQTDWFSFRTFQALSVRLATYSKIENDVLKIMGLEAIRDADFWQIVTQKQDRRLLLEIFNGVKFVSDQLPKLISLLSRSYPSPESSELELPIEDFHGKAVLRVILQEEDSQVSSTQRVIMALEGIQGIFDVFSRLNKYPDSGLLVVGIDSGSDKVFDLLGIASAVNDAKELIIGLFERIVFLRQGHASQNIEVIAQSLPVFSEINRLSKAGELSPEEAELIRRKLFSSLGKISDSGVVIPEMTSAVQSDPRLIMRPQPKLLFAPNDTTERPEIPAYEEVPTIESNSVGNEGELSPEEQRTLLRLLQRARDPGAQSASEGDGSSRKPPSDRRSSVRSSRKGSTSK